MPNKLTSTEVNNPVGFVQETFNFPGPCGTTVSPVTDPGSINKYNKN